ncbi:MAG TPA: YitT family protein [Clostridiales bacterium]|jgi:uncharacterized membrane-anchored protein YitT (DUF2179 family)|nr:YitT family protein [Clostridiales bacterium]
MRKVKDKRLKVVMKFLTIIAGALLMAVSINMVYEPLGMVTGGVSGLAIVAKKLTEPIMEGGFPIWLFTVLSNIPLYILSIRMKGKEFIFSAILGTIALTLALMVVPIYDLNFDDKLLASIFGGAIGGAGIGLIFSVSSSTGGTDLVATLIQDRYKHISVPQILNFVDGAIICIGALVFGINNALYAIIAVFITSKVSDGILSGLKFAKMAYIISDDYEKIAEEIMVTLDRGVTGVEATGMYSKKERKMLYCVVSKKEIIKIIEISKKIDPRSFVIIGDVREVMGEGFIEYKQ